MSCRLIWELRDAAESGDLEVVRRLIQDDGVDVDARLSYHTTALYLATQNHHSDVVQFLLDSDADVNAKNRWGTVPLHGAITNHWRDNGSAVLQLLLNHNGVDINATNNYDQNVLCYAIERHIALEDVQLLLNHGADITATPKTGLTALHHALRYGADLSVVELLLNHEEADINASALLGQTPLHEITPDTGISAQVMELLLLHNVDVYAKNENLQTPLHVLVKCNCTAAIPVLFRHVQSNNHSLESVLLCADKLKKRLPFHYVRSIEMAQLLLEQPLVNDQARVCHDMLLSKDDDGKTLVELLQLEEGALHDYLASYTAYPLAVPRSNDHRRSAAVRINPLLNEFQTNMVGAFLKSWLTLLRGEHDDDNDGLNVLPVELKYVVMSYLSVADIMKTQQE